MQAIYEGECYCGCGKKIHPGEEIEYHDILGWVASGHPIKTEVCPDCFMTKAANGTCGCD